MTNIAILDQVERGANIAVVATVPLSSMFGYIGQLRSMTWHYDPVPKNVADEVIEAVARGATRSTRNRDIPRLLANGDAALFNQ